MLLIIKSIASSGKAMVHFFGWLAILLKGLKNLPREVFTITPANLHYIFKVMICLLHLNCFSYITCS